jgi:hypothetical protein
MRGGGLAGPPDNAVTGRRSGLKTMSIIVAFAVWDGPKMACAHLISGERMR